MGKETWIHKACSGTITMMNDRLVGAGETGVQDAVGICLGWWLATGHGTFVIMLRRGSQRFSSTDVFLEWRFWQRGEENSEVCQVHIQGEQLPDKHSLHRRRRWQETGTWQSKPDDPSPPGGPTGPGTCLEKREEAGDHSKAPRLRGEVGCPGTPSAEG